MEGYKYIKGNNNSIVPQINRKTASFENGGTMTASNNNSETQTVVANEGISPSLKTSMEEEGVIPRAIRELFEQVEMKRTESQGKSKITVKVQYI